MKIFFSAFRLALAAAAAVIAGSAVASVDAAPVDPMSLNDLTTGVILKENIERYLKLKAMYDADKELQKEVARWKRQDNAFEYSRFIGMVPKKVVESGARQKTDTWFSEYAEHNKPIAILSESEDSYVIACNESHDRRQYPGWLNPAWKDTNATPEAMTFGHFFVVPKKRVYNIVDPEATANNLALIREMRSHFQRFISEPGSIDRAIRLRRHMVDEQHRKCLLLAVDLEAKEKVEEEYREVVEDLTWMEEDFKQLTADDFTFGFSPAPGHSHGHIHMHVWANPSALRRFSAKRHDHKHIPFEAVEMAHDLMPTDVDDKEE